MNLKVKSNAKWYDVQNEEEEKENELRKMYSITVRQMFKAECGWP